MKITLISKAEALRSPQQGAACMVADPIDTASTSGDPSVTFEVITPAIAAAYLQHNIHNRPIRPVQIERFAEAMQRGEWRTHHQGIGFATDGTLLDGQNRLLAIQRADIPVRLMVTRGLDPADFDAMDLGARRSGADVLAIRGEKNAHTLSAALGWLWRYENRQVLAEHARPSLPQIEDVLVRHPGIRSMITRGYPISRQHLLFPALATWLSYAIIRADADAGPRFIDAFGSGVGLREQDVVLVLRNRLMQNHQARFGVPPPMQAAFVIKTWNAYRSGRKLALLRLGLDESFPEISGYRQNPRSGVTTADVTENNDA